ncbi:NADP-dependent oxidoreductase domain-containing protein [Pelagophyceae sp. CCMP2097]|nr:NADP-dependent oxidoreductase domain-containing protein [Pelagophyceae sp. CCMP2097]
MLRVCALLGAALAAAAGVAPTVTVSPGVELPMVALGTGSGQHGDVSTATALWLGQAGGVAIDTAFVYGDEAAIAQGVAAARSDRAEIFLETKVPASSYAIAAERIQSNLKDLNTPYTDVLLIHYPGTLSENAATWRALEDALDANLTRAIGVSNFGIPHLTALATQARYSPSINQCELSVSFHDDETIKYCRDEGIVYQAFSPLCGGFNGSSCTLAGGINVLTIPEVHAVAAAHGVSTAQVGLKWIVQQGIPLATSIWTLPYMEEDLDLWSWGDLADAEMKTLAAVYRPA